MKAYNRPMKQYMDLREVYFVGNKRRGVYADMLEKMAAEEEAKNNPQPAEPEPEKKSSGSKKHSQSSLDLF